MLYVIKVTKEETTTFHFYEFMKINEKPFIQEVFPIFRKVISRLIIINRIIVIANYSIFIWKL